MKLVFMGTPEYAVPSLRAVHKAGHEILATVTQPPRPRGRGRSVQPSPVAQVALELEIDVLTPEKPNRRDAVAQIAALNPDVILVVAYGAILRDRLLAIPSRGCVNAHGSILPRHRGASPIAAAIAAGDSTTGVTLIEMVRELDAGPMLLKREIPIAPRESAGSLHDKLAELSAGLFVEYLAALEAGSAPAGVAQVDADSTYAPLLTKNDGRIDWRRSAKDNDRHVRAMSPWPGAFTSLSDGTVLKVHEMECLDGRADAAPGSILAASVDEGLVIASGEECVSLTKIQLPGRKAMNAEAFLRGHSLELGALLGDTSSD